jgi:hypothetical protein
MLLKKLLKNCKNLSLICQKTVIKLSKVVKKLSKSCQKAVKHLSKFCYPWTGLVEKKKKISWPRKIR